MTWDASDRPIVNIGKDGGRTAGPAATRRSRHRCSQEEHQGGAVHGQGVAKQMNPQALSRWKGAKLVKQQADSHRQHLDRLRDEALRALSQVQVPVPSRRKT